MLGAAHIARAANVLPDELCDALLLRQIRIDVVLNHRSLCLYLLSRIPARGDLRIVQRERDLSVVRRICHKHGRRGLIALRANRIGIELEQQLPALDRIALRDVRREMLALELHRVHADVDEEIDPVCRVNANRVL